MGTKNKIKKLMQIYDGKCFYCDRTVYLKEQELLPIASVDHYFPRSKGGGDEMGNLRLSCVSCNTAKGAKIPIGMTEEIYLAYRVKALGKKAAKKMRFEKDTSAKALREKYQKQANALKKHHGRNDQHYEEWTAGI